VYLHGIRPQELGGHVGHLDGDPLPGQRVPDEHHPTVRRPSQAVAAVRDRPDLKLEPVPEQ
jgi:hypothetical protein